MRPQAFKAFRRLRNNTGHDNPLRIRNVSADETEIWLYDEIGWFGCSADDIVEQLKAIDTPKLAVRINSPGGSVFDALAIHSCLKNHPATVTTYVDGLAASAASFIALAGDKVVTARNAMWMIHDASTLTWGNATELRKCADLLEQVSDNIADFYAEKAGGTIADWRALMGEETWYTGAEAVEAGLADEVASGKSGKRKQAPDGDDGEEPDDDYWDLAAMFRYAGRDKAPTPKVIDRSHSKDRAPDAISAEALSWLRAQTPQSITVSSTGAATTTITYNGDPSDLAKGLVRSIRSAVRGDAAEPATVEPVEAEPVVEQPADVEPETTDTEPVVDTPAEAEPAEPDDTTEDPADEPTEAVADETPAEQPVTDGEPAAGEDLTPAGPPPPATTDTPEPTDEWAAAVAGLTKPESVEDALTRLREACK